MFTHQRQGLPGASKKGFADIQPGHRHYLGLPVQHRRPLPPEFPLGAGCRQAARHFWTLRHHAALGLPALKKIRVPAVAPVVAHRLPQQTGADQNPGQIRTVHCHDGGTSRSETGDHAWPARLHGDIARQEHHQAARLRLHIQLRVLGEEHAQLATVLGLPILVEVEDGRDRASVVVAETVHMTAIEGAWWIQGEMTLEVLKARYKPWFSAWRRLSMAVR